MVASVREMKKIFEVAHISVYDTCFNEADQTEEDIFDSEDQHVEESIYENENSDDDIEDDDFSNGKEGGNVTTVENFNG